MKNIEKKWTLFLIATFVTFFGVVDVLLKGTQAVEVPVNANFDDMNFYKCVVDTYNKKNNTDHNYMTYNLSDEELVTIEDLKCDYGTQLVSEKITSVNGIEKMSNLQYLSLTSNSLSSLNILNNTQLKELYASNNEIIEINFDNNLMLEVLELSENLLEDISVSKLTLLKYLSLGNNLLTSIDVSNNLALEELYLGYDYINKKGYGVNYSSDINQIGSLDVSNNTNLKKLNVVSNNINSINVENNELLTMLNVSKNNIESLNLSNNLSLQSLYAYSNQLLNIDVSSNVLLEVLSIAENKITSLDVSSNNLLSILSIGKWCRGFSSSQTCGGNEISNLDLSKNSKITELYIDSNPLSMDIGIYKDSVLNNYNIVKFSDSIDYTILSSDFDGSGIIIDNKDIIVNNVGTYDVSVSYSHSAGNSYANYSGILKLNVIQVTSDVYEINEELSTIYTNYDIDLDTILGNINLNYGEKDIIDNKLVITYNGEIIKEFDLVSEEIIFDSTLNVDEDMGIIRDIEEGTTVGGIKEKIHTSYDIYVLEEDGTVIEDDSSIIKTGYQVMISLSDAEDEAYFRIYGISVFGDVNADGEVTKDDALKIAEHILTGEKIESYEYIYSADINKDGKISLNDMIKLTKHIVNGSGL